MARMTWKQFVQKAEAKMRAQGFDPETALLRYIDFHGYESDVEVERDSFDGQTPILVVE